MSRLTCPFYDNGCILKEQANLPEFKNLHDCKSSLDNCSFFIKPKIKQIKANLPVKIIIKQVENVFMVKADVLVYPTNNLLEYDHSFDKLTLYKAKRKADEIFRRGVKMGFPYGFESDPSWKNKQKYIINAVVAGESRLVNEADISSAMKKSLLMIDQLGYESALIVPCDYGTHDISLTSLTQLSAIFLFCQQHTFKNLKHIFVCMEDEESEQSFIEYFNRIFGEKNEPRVDENPAISAEHA